jgi:hypothetical protein
VIVGAVGKPGHARAIGPRQAVERDRSSAGQDQAVPSQQDPVLSDGNLAVIFAYEPRALGDEQDATGRAVVDVLRDLREDQRAIGTPFVG